ncbi:class V aminotransferase [Chitinimonas prasina]|uniref:Class V aminotransferase n=1 Tax=Chitinimonas prasina TaxID=1434937 RepID=A0ABQ5YHB1_9NEIS|nr:aminotransferase class V-fold PLP-dependent enzyme [Chitinimonas prasina]GLR12730.1 class V aminotransferase [Chitinimonas prasina]
MTATHTHITHAVAALGDGPLSEPALAAHIHPLFKQVLARDSHEIYLANHSLGRPLDATAADMAEGSATWFEQLDDAWGPWWSEMEAWRAATANLLGVARGDCIVPKTSAGQGLRAVLNSYAGTPRVLSTEAEFDSIDHILKQYAAQGRAELHWVVPDAQGLIQVDELIARLDGMDLVVVSQVFFASGQVLQDIPRLIAAAHARGVRVLLDVYHGYGVLPLDLASLGVDYAIAGSYKYLRGGPGVCWLYVSPTMLDAGHTTLDTGWFAKRQPFAYRRPMPPEFAAGGDAWLESTFNPLGFYQARAGLALVTAMGVARLRAYSLQQKGYLSDLLSTHGIRHFGVGEEAGAFITIPHADPMALASQLKTAGINGDARAAGLRLCPDLLNTEAQMRQAVEVLAAMVG